MIGKGRRLESNCCHLNVEDEYRIILLCPFYHKYMQLYIKKYYGERPIMYKNVNELSNLVNYI